MPKAAGRSVAICETTLHREEAVADGVGRCLLFLEGFVNLKKTAPLGAIKFAKVYVQFNCIMLFPCAQICSCHIMILQSPGCPNFFRTLFGPIYMVRLC